MEPIRTLRSRTLVLAQENIDTDQIIPARFLKTTERRGLGQSLFADWRYDEHGKPKPDSPFDGPTARGVSILIAGDNFGCGSSREHAAWALRDFGIRAVVSSSIADIFAANAVKNGIVPVVIDASAHRFLLRSPGADATLDLEAGVLAVEDWMRVPFRLDPFARYCLLHGIDELRFLLDQEEAIEAYEEDRSCTR